MSYNPANLIQTTTLPSNTPHLQFAPTRYIVPPTGQYVPTNLVQAIGNGQRIPLPNGVLPQRLSNPHTQLASQR